METGTKKSVTDIPLNLLQTSWSSTNTLRRAQT